MNQLLEMFPNACALEVSHCLKMAVGDLEEAAQLIICREETGQNLKSSMRKASNLTIDLVFLVLFPKNCKFLF
jgi:hypothetical protein